MSHSSSRLPLPYLFGLDWIRVLGMTLVLLQHQFSVLGHEPETTWAGINIGQVGVSLFLVMSGLLSAGGTPHAVQWFCSRLRRIYPAFWLATGISFLAAIVTGQKSVDLIQFLSQMAGLGFWTHGDEMVNVAHWYISFLLVLCVVSALGRWIPLPRGTAAVGAVVCVILVLCDRQTFLASHALTYFLAQFLLSPSRTQNRSVPVFVAMALLLLSLNYRPFIYSGISLGLCSCMLRVERSNRAVRFLSRYSYEFYLIHGIVLVGAQKFFGKWPLISVPIGIAGSVFLAIVMQHFLKSDVRKFAWFSTRRSAPAARSLNS